MLYYDNSSKTTPMKNSSKAYPPASILRKKMLTARGNLRDEHIHDKKIKYIGFVPWILLILIIIQP